MCARKLAVCLSVIAVLAGPAYGALVPVGTYDIEFSRTGWSEARTISVQAFPTPEAFYSVGGQDVNVYMEEVAQPEPTIWAYTWYVNAPAVLSDPTTNTLLGGTGDLTITVSNMSILDTSTGITHTDTTHVHFEPLVTHIYYVGYGTDGYFKVKDIPGGSPVSPGIDQIQRTPIQPVVPGEPDYNPADPYYGAAHAGGAGTGISFVLPDMYVPSDVGGTVWELSFGAGFSIAEAPEPSVITLLLCGIVPLVARRRK